jgi:hypothetical protein
VIFYDFFFRNRRSRKRKKSYLIFDKKNKKLFNFFFTSFLASTFVSHASYDDHQRSTMLLPRFFLFHFAWLFFPQIRFSDGRSAKQVISVFNVCFLFFSCRNKKKSTTDREVLDTFCTCPLTYQSQTNWVTHTRRNVTRRVIFFL